MTAAWRIVLLLLCPLAAGASSSCVAAGASAERERRGAPFSSRCAPTFPTHLDEILRRHGVERLSTFVPSGVLEAQRRAGRPGICPERALELALEAFLGRDDPESPRDVARSLGPAWCGARCYLDRASSLLGVVAGPAAPLPQRLLPSPPGGSDTKNHWIFYLRISDLDEHVYWALVGRRDGAVQLIGVN